jgi:hypothetical protein
VEVECRPSSRLRKSGGTLTRSPHNRAPLIVNQITLLRGSPGSVRLLRKYFTQLGCQWGESIAVTLSPSYDTPWLNSRTCQILSRPRNIVTTTHVSVTRMCRLRNRIFLTRLNPPRSRTPYVPRPSWNLMTIAERERGVRLELICPSALQHPALSYPIPCDGFPITGPCRNGCLPYVVRSPNGHRLSFLS